MSEAVDIILRKNQLSVTGSRKKILELFLGSRGDALAHADIERKAGEKFDRVTIYRTLQTFVDKGIIHSIPTADNSVRYALCKEDCRNGHHNDNHIHFICSNCERTICLEDVVVPTVTLPEEFAPAHSQMLITGICKQCRN
ncbi:MAG TPA: transcriptional repressor [Chitinophagaceae bacterium]|nr:transcriptional repressor [Chitinophagaceae bacterium]